MYGRGIYVIRPLRAVPVFHVLRPEAFEYGTTTATIEGVAVPIGDAERTLLDLLDCPDVARSSRCGAAI
jgi:hypothetical protein